jgi:hypothetical protein
MIPVIETRQSGPTNDRVDFGYGYNMYKISLPALRAFRKLAHLSFALRERQPWHKGTTKANLRSSRRVLGKIKENCEQHLLYQNQRRC